MPQMTVLSDSVPGVLKEGTTLIKTLLVIPGKVGPSTLVMGAKNVNKKQEVNKEEYNAERVEEEQEENF